MAENCEKLILAIPSKGRLMAKTMDVFADAGHAVVRVGHERGYLGEMVGLPHVEVRFLSASEIAYQLRAGLIHLGVTGEDLIRETIFDAARYVELITPLGFGQADVVVAVPRCWLDVNVMADLEDVADRFFSKHGHRLRVATKYVTLTRRFFAGHRLLADAETGERQWHADKGAPVTGYLIVGSVGATEGAPAAGTAELIVDITSTGTTLEANHLKILDDGVILRSEANLVASKRACWSDAAQELREMFRDAIRGQPA